MSELKIYREDDPAAPRVLTDRAATARELDGVGVLFEAWSADRELAADAGEAEVIAAYRDSVDRLMSEYGFQSVDVVSLKPDHPQKDALRAKFLDEHTHSEHEVRFFVDGRGLFYIHMHGHVYADARSLAGRDLDDAELAAELRAWIDRDSKATPLKALQGLIWEEGYRRGAFSGHVYPDAARRLRAWKDLGIALYVYSSGSVHAQRLLFAHTGEGDLTPLFSGYFDTTVGHKREPASYRAIAAAIGLAPGEILFLSDIHEELDAARAAGMQTAWLVREGALDPDAEHPQARDFEGIAV
jgi:enolase-phosphatase E1